MPKFFIILSPFLSPSIPIWLAQLLEYSCYRLSLFFCPTVMQWLLYNMLPAASAALSLTLLHGVHLYLHHIQQRHKFYYERNQALAIPQSWWLSPCDNEQRLGTSDCHCREGWIKNIYSEKSWWAKFQKEQEALVKDSFTEAPHSLGDTIICYHRTLPQQRNHFDVWTLFWFM